MQILLIKAIIYMYANGNFVGLPQLSRINKICTTNKRNRTVKYLGEVIITYIKKTPNANFF